MRSRRQLVQAGALVVAAAILALLILWMSPWENAEDAGQSAKSAAMAGHERAASIPAAVSAAIDPGSVNPVGPAMPRAAVKKPPTAKELYLSNDPGLIDFAGMVLGLNCLSLRTTEDAWMQTAESGIAKFREQGDISAGKAGLADRVAAYRKSREVCGVFYPDGQLDDEFYARLRTMAAFKRVRSLRESLEVADLGTPEGKSLLKEVMDAPLYSSVRYLMYQRLEFSNFADMASDSTGGQLLWWAGMELMMCRMGDDCGPDSPRALQLCWQAAICGGDVETAFRTHIRAVGLDADLLSRRVTELHSRLQMGDTSWLRERPSKSK